MIESLGPGGAEHALVDLATEATRRGHTCDVVVLWPPYTLEKRLAGTGVTVHHLDLRHRRDALRAVTRLLRLSRRLRPTVIHAQLFFAGVYTAATRMFDGRPTRVYTFQNLDYVGYPATSAWGRLRRTLERITMRFGVHGHSAVSSAAARHVEAQLGLEHVDVVENGVNLALLNEQATAQDAGETLRSLGVPERGPLLVCSARLVHQKGHDYLIEAAALLAQRGIEFHLVLAGGGPRQDELAQSVRDARLQDRVTLTGYLPHTTLIPLISRADAIVLTSLYEGLPLAVIEAQALGTAVISTRVGGVPELIDHERNGLLVTPRDAAALADALARFLTEGDLQARFERAARQGRQRSDISRVADHYERLYDSVRRRRSTTQADR